MVAEFVAQSEMEKVLQATLSRGDCSDEDIPPGPPPVPPPDGEPPPQEPGKTQESGQARESGEKIPELPPAVKQSKTMPLGGILNNLRSEGKCGVK